eukprot:Tbor_TRINITY_DN5168_c0_g3::TRINITY_DN5168_c0_g3_i1::g.25607::m.25607/K10753/ASF1; histone chaperone ASF1
MSFPLIQLAEVELMSANPSNYCEGLSWKFRVEVLDNLTEPISIGFQWVGSALSSEYDQQLDEFTVGPFPTGASEFLLECDGPDPNLVPRDELIGVTVLQIFMMFRGQCFLKIGYYSQVAYFDDFLNNNPPLIVDSSMLARFLVMSQPSIVSIPIVWYKEGEIETPNEIDFLKIEI